MSDLLKNKTLLIVDDEKDLREPLALEFESLGCQVFQARNGKEAFDIVLREKIDAVISDIRMPGGDGIELLKKIKAQNPIFPVVMLITGFTDLSHEEAYHLGAEAVLAKPFDLDAVDAAVVRILTPKEVRWKNSEGNEKVKRCIERTFTALTHAVEIGEIAIGRGGIFVHGADTPPRGEVVEFQIKFQSGEVLHLSGKGIVRWSRSMKDQDLPRGCGIEFEFLSDEARTAVLELVETSTLVPFIPKGPMGLSNT
jgi:two-component system chemotaxis response regulator CheY